VGAILSKEAMPVTIPDEVLKAAHISEPELKQELALTLFRQERLTLGQASRLAEMTQLAFQALLADRQIPIHYGVEEFREDVRTSPQPERF
jgi:predicted HTH domain antitoxin